MANWIKNTLKINGPKSNIDNFLNLILNSNNQVDFELIIPSPSTKQTCPLSYICDARIEGLEPIKGKEWFNWYKWNKHNWGTKWNANDTEIFQEGPYAEIKFQTPNTTPDLIMDKIGSKMTKGLHVLWEALEEQGQFEYKVEFKDNLCIWSTHPCFSIDKLSYKK